jgi:pyruvate/2-oxoglutarate dehydrogenase complex dihydrolipoamide acyltransferase (E2) component
MRSPIVMPDLGDGAVILSAWLARPGDHVYAGDRLVEVLLEGATFDISSPATGQFLEKSAWPDEVLAAGQVLGYVEEYSSRSA